MDALHAVLEYPPVGEVALADAPRLRLVRDLPRPVAPDRGPARAAASEYLRALRPQHWLKNLLTFLPLLAAHLFFQPLLLGRTVAVFVAFCCCASSGYLVNDLCDLPADRRHPRKRLRPFASGRLPQSYGWVAAPTLAILGCTLAGMVSGLALGVVLLYLAATLAYSLSFKKIEVLDVVVLACLYTLRIVGGAAAISLWPSIWLFAFSMFLFISLALVKRYAELMTMRSVDGERARARGYELSDAELLSSTGTTSGYAAVVVLALYIASGAAQTLYSRHQLMWLVCPLLLYWIGYVWLKAHRGAMHHDPLVFALRDRRSRTVLMLMLAAAAAAM
ncbi:MAG TPA: UbiA family prenyltransferase [Steroidobacteraceae bacterium]|nr:UbiA family prenyltransferase [Steroidobacteraceae bacterium]